MSDQTIALLFIAAGIVLGLLVLRKLAGWVSMPCRFCQAKLTPFRRLPVEEQEKILDYFREYEHLEPNERRILVCLNCRVVHDDRSGVKEAGEQGIQLSGIFCKVCSALMFPYKKVADITCTNCGTAYTWRKGRDTDLRFFAPPREAKVSEHFVDVESALRGDFHERVQQAENVRHL